MLVIGGVAAFFLLSGGNGPSIPGITGGNISDEKRVELEESIQKASNAIIGVQEVITSASRNEVSLAMFIDRHEDNIKSHLNSL